MIEEPVEASEGLQDTPESCVVYGLWRGEEEILLLLTEEGSGKEAGEEPNKLILQLIPIKLNPSATAQAIKSPLLVAPSLELLHILPSPTSHSTPETPTAKVIPSTLPALQNLKKLVAYVPTCATTSKTLAELKLYGTADGLGAGSDLEHLDLSNSTSSTSSNSLQRLEKLV